MNLLRKHIFLFLLISMLLPASGQEYNTDILDGKNRAVVNFNYIHNFVVVRVKLFDALSFNFIVDTGAEHSILFEKQIADFFGLEYARRIPILGSDLSRELYALIARNVDLQVEGLAPVKQDILVLEDDFFNLDQMTGTKIDGILGGSFFKQLVLRIDYKRNRLYLINPEKFVPPGTDYIHIPVEVRSNKPYITAEAVLLDNTAVELILLMDTGAGLPLLLHNNSHPALNLPTEYILGQLGVGLGGYVQGYIGRIKTLDINGLQFDQVVTSFQDVDTTIVFDDTRYRNGLIGNQLLSRFQVYLDYIDESLYLKPMRKYKRKFRIDKSGLVIFATGMELDEYIVQGVIAASPADEAGILPGDRIKRFQGWPARFYSLDQIYHVLQKREGKLIRIVIERGELVLKKEFCLEELI